MFVSFYQSLLNIRIVDYFMDSVKPVIFDYMDYRQYLEAAYKYFKARNRLFSYRFISIHTGASSAGWFPNIIKGRINLTSAYILKLATLLKLQPSEAEYFETLINYNQASRIDEKNFYFDKLKSIKGIKPALVRQEHLSFLSKWYISVIRELLFIYDFRDDYKSLGKMLIPEISESEVKEAIDILRLLSFVKVSSKGRLKPCEPVLKKDPSIKTDLWSSHMKAKMDLGMKSIDRFPKEERDISEVYMPFSKEGFELAKEEIAKLRKRLLVIAESDPAANRVFQCTIQLFPLTKNLGDKTV